jgi:hypothetical protein
MEASEGILIFQLITMFITGVVIVWYTYETSIIRRETTR